MTTRRTALWMALAAPAFAQGTEAAPSSPPETPPLQPYKLPAVKEHKLANGLGLTLVHDKRFPLVSLRLAFGAGSRYDPQDRQGLAETVASLLKAGTQKRTSRQMAEELASAGATLDVDESDDALMISGMVLAENLERLIELAADAVRHAVFPEDELRLRKQNRRQELIFLRSQAATLAREKLRAVVFGAHPYARMLPLPQSIEAITRQDLIQFRDRLLAPANAHLILVGAVPPEKQTLAWIRAHFGDWQNKPAPAAPAGDWPAPAFSITLVDRPGSAQVDIHAGHVSVNRSSQDHFPLLVASGILGGGTSSRLFVNIREKQGFAYHANCHHQPLKDTGLFEVITQVREDVLEPALKALLAELKRMGEEPVSSQELGRIQNYLNGVFVLQLATQSGVANQLASLKVHGLPRSYLETYVTRIRAVSAEQVQAVAKRYFDPQQLSVVVVGDASRIQKTVEKFGPVRVEKAQ